MKTKQANVKPGTTILTEKPFVYILNSKFRTDRCDNCFENKKLLKCSGCHHIYYCGRVCQKESWNMFHKFECSNLKRVQPKLVPDAARLLARLIIKLQKGGDMIKGYYTDISFRKFKDLMSHYSDIKEDTKRMDHFTSLCGVLFEYLGETLIPNSAELLGIYGRMCINGFNICDPEMTSIGTGIYLAASILDHSCKPNAVAVFQGTTLHIRALELLPVLDWTQIRISYVDLLSTPEERQKDLLANYYFLCQCSVCLDIKLLNDMDSAICSNINCRAQVGMTAETEDMPVHCKKCNDKITPEFKSLYKEIVDFTNNQLKNMKNVAYLDICKICLKKHEQVLHPLNIVHIKILDLAFESCIQMSNWNGAEEYGIRLLPGYRKYYGYYHPMTGILYLKMGKLMLFKNNISEALQYLNDAKNIISITHGQSHSLYKDSLLPLLYQGTMENSFNKK